MVQVVTINRPEVVGMIEQAAKLVAGGNKTEAVAIALRALLASQARPRSLFGAHPGSVTVQKGVDLVAPALDVMPDAASGFEPSR